MRASKLEFTINAAIYSASLKDMERKEKILAATRSPSFCEEASIFIHSIAARGLVSSGRFLSETCTPGESVVPKHCTLLRPERWVMALLRVPEDICSIEPPLPASQKTWSSY